MALTEKQRLKQQIRMMELAGKTWNTEIYAKAGDRAAKMGTDAILQWIDDSLLKIGQATFDYRAQHDLEGRQHIARELVRSVSIYQALAEELLFRNGIEF